MKVVYKDSSFVIEFPEKEKFILATNNIEQAKRALLDTISNRFDQAVLDKLKESDESGWEL